MAKVVLEDGRELEIKESFYKKGDMLFIDGRDMSLHKTCKCKNNCKKC